MDLVELTMEIELDLQHTHGRQSICGYIRNPLLQDHEGDNPQIYGKCTLTGSACNRNDIPQCGDYCPIKLQYFRDHPPKYKRKR